MEKDSWGYEVNGWNSAFEGEPFGSPDDASQKNDRKFQGKLLIAGEVTIPVRPGGGPGKKRPGGDGEKNIRAVPCALAGVDLHKELLRNDPVVLLREMNLPPFVHPDPKGLRGHGRNPGSHLLLPALHPTSSVSLFDIPNMFP
jgi:hypothetical protein